MSYFEKFKEIVLEEVKNTFFNKKNKTEETGSFLELLKLPSSQSISIKIGNVLEKSYNKLIFNINGVENIKDGMISNHQIDLLFLYNNCIYYFEIKNNINLDTEKTRETFNKIKDVEGALLKKYDNVVSKILVNRFPTKEKMKFFKNPISKNDLIGYSDFFDLFNVSVSEAEWKEFFNYVGEVILKDKEI